MAAVLRQAASFYNEMRTLHSLWWLVNHNLLANERTPKKLRLFETKTGQSLQNGSMFSLIWSKMSDRDHEHIRKVFTKVKRKAAFS